MTDETLRSRLSAMITDAVAYQTNELGPERAKATDYFNGKPFGNEEEGRSQVVQTEVRDAILATLPSVVKLFFGPERQVEFLPRRADTIEQAAQASDYVQYLFAEENDGFMATLSVLTDGFLHKMGIFKYGLVEGDVRSYELENVTEAQLETLAADDRVELIEQYESGETAPAPADPAAMADGVLAQPEKLYTVKCSVQDKERIMIEAVPPEEFCYSRGARTIKDAQIVFHRCEKTRSELLAMGISEEDLDEHGSRDASLKDNPESLARNPGALTGGQDDEDGGEENSLILYVEAYPKIDCDGDGRAELRKICTIGPGHYVVSNEPVDERPFAPWCPVPTPHSLGGGMSLADLVMDLQRTKSFVLRGILDSLAASLFPRTAFQEGMVNVNDILNTEIGAPIRTKTIPSNAIQTFSHPFTGQQAMPILEYFDVVGESRTGRDRGAMGIDADALQSSTDEAVGAAVSASQERIELYARIFAEQALKPLFKGILKLLVATKPKARIVRLRGKFIDVDPAAWDAEMDVTVNVALGTTLVQRKLAGLGNIIAKQEQVLQLLGPQNPICTLAQYRESLAMAVELYGFRDPSKFFSEVPPNWQPPQQAPQKTPEETLAEAQMQIEQMKTLKDIEIKKAELEMKRADSDRDHRRQLAMDAADISLRTLELQLKYGAANAQQQFEQQQAKDEQMLNGMQMVAEHARDTERHQHEMELERQAQEHDQQMAEQQAAAAQEQAAQPAPEE